MKHHDYVYGGHGSAVSDALRQSGRESATPGMITELTPFRRVTSILSQLSMRSDLTAEQVRDILAHSRKHITTLEAATEAAKRLVSEAREGLGLDDLPAESASDPSGNPGPAPVPPIAGEPAPIAEGGEKQPLELQNELENRAAPSLIPSGPPTEEIVNAPDGPPSGEDIQHAAGIPIEHNPIEEANPPEPTDSGVDSGGSESTDASEDDRDAKQSRRKKGR
jgi:hypothetical protein